MNLHRISMTVGRLAALLLTLISMSGVASGQEPLSKKESRQIVEYISEAQTPWERLELSGKLKMDGLPVSPKVKIYMERGNRLDISISAPFMGEVGRVQATRDSLLLVNKMKKTYWSGSMEEISEKYPGGIEMIQSVLLGQVYIFGEGVITPDMTALFNIFPDEEAGWLLMPKPNYQVPGARYGYVVDEEGEAAALVIEREESEDFLQLDYIGKKNGKYDVDLLLVMGSKTIEGTLAFDSPKENPVPISPFSPDAKYTRLTIKEFIRKFLSN